MKAGYVKTDMQKEGLLEIEFFHPKHNALPSHLLQQLERAINEAGANEAVQVILLKSGGNRTFCAGASFEELMAIQDFASGKQFFMGFAKVINACRKCPKLILGRIQGKAVGGGVGLAAAVDYCLATQYAAIKLSELSIGIGPFVIAPAVERKMGIAALSQMTINGTAFYPATWAKSKGLYADVFETAVQLDEALYELADFLLSTSPTAKTMLKTMFWEGCDHWEMLLEQRAEKSGQLVLSDYTKQALSKFAKS